VACAFDHVALGVHSRFVEPQSACRIHDAVVLAITDQHGGFNLARSSPIQIVVGKLFAGVG